MTAVLKKYSKLVYLNIKDVLVYYFAASFRCNLEPYIYKKNLHLTKD